MARTLIERKPGEAFGRLAWGLPVAEELRPSADTCCAGRQGASHYLPLPSKRSSEPYLSSSRRFPKDGGQDGPGMAKYHRRNPTQCLH